MFIVLLRFSTNRDQVGAFMDAHREWITRGFEEFQIERSNMLYCVDTEPLPCQLKAYASDSPLGIAHGIH